MHRFESLDIWQLAIQYGVNIYKMTKKFPKDELYSLTNQMRRAAVSVSSNIAEGSGASSSRDFAKFLDIAIKSNMETISQTIFAEKMEYITGTERELSINEGTTLLKKIRSFKQYIEKTITH